MAKKAGFIQRKERGDKAVTLVSYILMGIAGFLALAPFVHVVSKAFSSASAVTSGQVTFYPREPQIETVKFILTETMFLKSLMNTVIVTVAGTILSMLVTITTAYPLSKTHLKGRKLFLILYIFSMLFYGGMVPAYMVIKTLGLMDTYGALILPFIIIQFNMLVVKNYIEGLPESVEESAKMDGAGYFRILFSIICPMSVPVIATVSLLYAVNYWNNYVHAMLYTISPGKKTLQLFIYDTVYSAEAMLEKLMTNEAMNVSVEGLRSAAVVLSIIPIVLLYPAIQRFFVQGITIGSVKG
jgi:putative aldouronate transport system permease protein